MKNYKFILVFALFVASCSPIKRLERMQKRHPYLFTAQTDTLFINDTIPVIIPGTTIDTSVSVSSVETDTAIFEKDGLTVKAWIKNDSLNISAENKEKTIPVVYQKKVPVKKYVLPKPRDKLRWREFVSLFVICLFFFFCGRSAGISEEKTRHKKNEITTDFEHRS